MNDDKQEVEANIEETPAENQSEQEVSQAAIETFPLESGEANASEEEPVAEAPVEPVVEVVGVVVDEPEPEPEVEVEVQCALLDENDMFIGMAQVLPSQATDRHVLTVTSCDLAVGQYKWHFADQTFHSVKSRSVALALALAAIQDQFDVLTKNDIKVPLDTLIWLKSLSA